jgi:hypothetical protein
VPIRASVDPRRTIAAVGEAKPDVVFHPRSPSRATRGSNPCSPRCSTASRSRSRGRRRRRLERALHKPLAREKLVEAGVPVPAGFTLERPLAPLPREFRRAPRAR